MRGKYYSSRLGKGFKGDLYIQRSYIYRYVQMFLGSRTNFNPARMIWLQQPKQPHQSLTSSYNGLLRRTTSPSCFAHHCVARAVPGASYCSVEI